MEGCELRIYLAAGKGNYVAFFHGLQLGKIGLRHFVVQLKPNRFFKLAPGFIQVPRFRQQHFMIKMNPRVVWIQPHRLAKFISRLVKLVG